VCGALSIPKFFNRLIIRLNQPVEELHRRF
jgi:hypothetical protein